MANRIHRVTMFKLPNEAHQQQLTDAYKILSMEQLKDGKPYILSLVCGSALKDTRSQGFTVVAKTEFGTLEDMRWYDDHCPAHMKLKSIVRKLGINRDRGEIISVYFRPGHIETL